MLLSSTLIDLHVMGNSCAAAFSSANDAAELGGSLLLPHTTVYSPNTMRIAPSMLQQILSQQELIYFWEQIKNLKLKHWVKFETNLASLKLPSKMD